MKPHSKILSAIVVLAFTTLTLLVLIYMPASAAGPWYVAQSGNDSNTCLAPATPCATINGAIGKAAPSDTIYVATGTYTSSTGIEVVLLNKSATLSGGWDATFSSQNSLSTIDGGEVRWGITVNSGMTVVIDRFVIQNSSTLYPDGVGILNNGTLTLNNSIVRDNKSINNNGRGILNTDTLTLSNCTVSGNNGVGIVNVGGNVTLTNSSISGNSGGIHSSSGMVTLTNSSVNSNTDPYTGGIYNYYTSTLILTNSTVNNNMETGIINWGTLTLTNSIVSGNISQNSNGGGIRNQGGSAILTNSTVSGNTGQDGGGILNISSTLTLNNSTISGNTSKSNGGGIYNAGVLIMNNSTVSGNTSQNNGGGIWIDIDSQVTMQNSIFAANTASWMGQDGYGGILVSSGYNLIGDASYFTFNASTGDILNTEAKLWPFLMGSPGVHPLLPGSPAIDAGNPDGCKDNLGNSLDTDQRGVVRVGRCDIGAYEFDPANPLRKIYLPLISKP